MIDKKRELLDYIENCEKADLLNQQIQELDQDILDLEKGLRLRLSEKIESIALRELRNLRIKRLSLELELNATERKALQFEVAAEIED